jgi:uncharacterized protein YwgA
MEMNNAIPDNFIKLLLLVKLANKVEGKTMFHKMVFLGENEEPMINFGFEFTKYNYGPYSFELTKALDSLETLGLISVDTSLFASSDSGGFQTKQFTYTLTSKGVEVTENSGIEKTQKEMVDKIKQLLKKWNNVPRQKIIEYVYSKYM